MALICHFYPSYILNLKFYSRFHEDAKVFVNAKAWVAQFIKH